MTMGNRGGSSRSRFFEAVAELLSWGIGVMMGTPIFQPGSPVTDLTLESIRERAFELAPDSDPDTLEEVARCVARCLGLDGEGVLWPVHRRGDQRGQKIIPQYLTISLQTGQAWFASRHYSGASVSSAFRRGNRRGFGRGKRTGVQETQAYTKG